MCSVLLTQQKDLHYLHDLSGMYHSSSRIFILLDNALIHGSHLCRLLYALHQTAVPTSLDVLLMLRNEGFKNTI
jgi:hypothetical protein